MKRKEILEELDQLSRSENFLSCLTNILGIDYNSPAGELGTRNMREMLNMNEMSLLFGFWLKNRNKPKIDSTKCSVDFIRQKMEDLHWSIMSEIPKDIMNLSYEDLMINSAMLLETTFYAGSGAYDYQYAHFFQDEYFYDQNWLKKNKSIDSSLVLDFYAFFKSIFTYRINLLDLDRNTEELYLFHKESFIFKKYPQFKRIMEMITIKENENVNENFSSIGDLNEFSIRPVIERGEYYFVPIPFMISEALYKAPFYWMLEDNEYKPLIGDSRGKSAERLVTKLLSRVFGDKVRQNVLVKPNKTKTITDLDVCVQFQNTLLVFQVKSKKLTQLSKKGDLSQLKKDFKLAVEDAYQQAIIAYDPILNNETKLVDENFNELIDTKEIEEIYSVCIVLDNYPPLSSHTNIFYEQKEITPVAINIFDLEIIVQFLSKPEELVNYIKKRTVNSKIFRADGELSYLWHFLRYGLEIEPGVDRMMLDSDYGQQFDYHFYMKLVKAYESRLPHYVAGITRNDLCFCGQRKKFKLCCGKQHLTTHAM